jgi:hypothetical protein
MNKLQRKYSPVYLTRIDGGLNNCSDSVLSKNNRRVIPHDTASFENSERQARFVGKQPDDLAVNSKYPSSCEDKTNDETKTSRE